MSTKKLGPSQNDEHFQACHPCLKARHPCPTGLSPVILVRRPYFHVTSGPPIIITTSCPPPPHVSLPWAHPFIPLNVSPLDFETNLRGDSPTPLTSTHRIHHIAMFTTHALTIRRPRPTTVHPHTTCSHTFNTIPRRQTIQRAIVLLHNYHCPNTCNTPRTSLMQGSQEQGGDNLHPNQLSTHPLQISAIAVNPPLLARAK